MKTPTTPSQYSWIQPLLTIFALLACLGAILRIVNVDLGKRIDETSLLYLGAAGALLLLRDVKSLAFGSYKVEFDRRFDELENKVQNAQAVAIGRGGSARRAESSRTGAEPRNTAQPGFVPVPGQVEDDPWKGVFGKQRVSGKRELDAEVTPIGTPGLFRVQLQVRSTDPRRVPLRGSVQFFLHTTFGNHRPVVTVGPGGTADLTLTAWGAFTVGALADDGRTKLELDLAELSEAPADFRTN